MNKPLWLMFMLLLSSSHFFAQEEELCSNDVTYSTEVPEVNKKIVLHLVTDRSTTPHGKLVHSPQNSHAFVEVDPDYQSHAQPWNTSLYVTGPSGIHPVLQATFLDHGNTFSAHWINDQLIFIQVWWGRFGSSDLILDISADRFLYNRFAHYRLPQEPCQDAISAAMPQ